MKTKYLLLTIGALVMAGGIWFGRAAWRAHKQIITLHVRNAPLAEVLRKVESQTWKKIRAEKNLDARITLNVTDKPLSDVLDLIGEQAGARWSTLHAVYNSARARRSLDSALRGDGKLEPAGWTKIAPSTPSPETPGPDAIGPIRLTGPGPDGSMPLPGGGRVIVKRGPGGEMVVNANSDVELGPSQQQRFRIGEMAGGKGGQMMVRKAGDGPMIFQNGSGAVEMWSPEELLLESTLTNRLAGKQVETNEKTLKDGSPANAAEAARVAQEVKGKCDNFIAFRKSLMGIGFPRPGNGPPNIAAFRQAQNDRFARLTPEQRVQRARQRLASSQKSTNQPPQ